MNINNPKISVIVPVYNAEKTLKRAIDSILSQTYTDYEVILVNDGSKDSSGKICDEYASKYDNIRVIHKPNGGASSARNAALPLAKGEWITFCDSDDYVYPEWLENYDLENADDVDLIHQGIEGNKPIFQKGYRSFNDNDKEIQLFSSINFFEQAIETKVLGYTVVKAFRRSIIEQNDIEFDERIKLREDELFVWNYLQHSSKCEIVNKIGYYYFVPDWNRKYKFQSIFFEEIIKQLTTFFGSAENEYVAFMKDSHTCHIMESFPTQPKLHYLKIIRSYHKEDINCTRLSKPIKYIIVNDPTYVISWPVFYLYSLTRSLYYKIKSSDGS